MGGIFFRLYVTEGAVFQAGLHKSEVHSLEFAAMHYCLPPESVDIEEPKSSRKLDGLRKPKT